MGCTTRSSIGTGARARGGGRICAHAQRVRCVRAHAGVVVVECRESHLANHIATGTECRQVYTSHQKTMSCSLSLPVVQENLRGSSHYNIYIYIYIYMIKTPGLSQTLIATIATCQGKPVPKPHPHNRILHINYAIYLINSKCNTTVPPAMLLAAQKIFRIMCLQ